MERPKIITLNVQPSTCKALEDKGYNITIGSLGKLIDTKNQSGEFKYCLINNDYPSNLHEFDMVILDLDFVEEIEYKAEENKRMANSTGNNTYILCAYPQTILDPRPLASQFLVDDVQQIMKRESIIIAFQTELKQTKYTFVEENGNYPKNVGSEERDIYEALPHVPFSSNKSGKETKVVSNQGEITRLLERYNDKFSYQNTFYHPTEWKGNNKVLASYFLPLVVNRDDEIVSYAMRVEKSILIVLPNLKVTSDFIIDFMETVGPAVVPGIFPDSQLNSWINDPDYYIPNHQKLLDDKKLLKQEWEEKTATKNSEIESNYDNFKFLHEILTESGDSLVNATIKFLEWLGFEDVKNMDDEDPETLEEDIQIETNKGLLVIEVKGIGGTSKDSECSQISKIKFRRAEERGSFDVFGLYIVNHQRHLPPRNRSNPPFTKNQLKDAVNEKRGLMTTFQLFNLFFEIENGLITKEEGIDRFYDFGLVEFKPSNLQFIDTVEEIYLEGSVFIINLNGIEINVGDNLYVEKNGSFEIITITGLQVDDVDVQSVNNGEVGVKSSSKVRKKSIVYIKNMP